MAIKKEFYQTRFDGVKLFRTYSDSELMIRKVGTDEIYSEAIDVEYSGFEYEETNTPIDIESQEGGEHDISYTNGT